MVSPNRDHYATDNALVRDTDCQDKPESHRIIITLAKAAYYRDLTMTIKAHIKRAEGKHALARFFPVPQG